MERTDRLDVFDIIILVLLTAMIVLSPLAMGSVAPWARNSLFVLSLLLTFLWLLQGAVRGKIVLARDPVFLFAALFFFVVFVQLIPLGPGLLKTLSPSTAEVYEKTLHGYPASGEARTISLAPYLTEWELRRIVSLFLVFLVIVNTFRTRRQVRTLILAMIVVGIFEALYGFADYAAGGRGIFWNESVLGGHRVSGTFINKNHFAGLMEMIVPVVVGLCMAAAPKRILGGNLKARTVEAISSPSLHRQVLLGVLIVIMTVAIFFSLSRAGIGATVGAWVPFFLFLGLTTGSRKYTLTALLIVLAILCMFLGTDSGIVVDHFEDAFSGESISWNARVNIWHSALGMLGDFPVLGTGLGTFKEGFERYQSALFGDRYAAFAHNDWLQVFCETGFVGGLAAVAGILFFFIRMTRKTLRRRDSFCRWIATGALAGCLAMLIHSFFDFNLYKVTSNGLVFAAVLGIWRTAAVMPGKNERSRERKRARTFVLPLGPVPFRVFFGLAALAAGVLLSIQPVRSAAADIHFNRYLELTDTPVEQSRLYHFLPRTRDTSLDPSQELERAGALDGDNPLILFFRGIEKIREADELVWKQARASAKMIAGEAAVNEGGGGGSSALEKNLFDSLVTEPQMAARRRPFLEAGKRLVTEAVARSPASSLYHLLLTKIIAGINNPEGGPDGESEEAKIVLWLAPRKPETLFLAGKIGLLEALKERDSKKRPAALSPVFGCFRQCIACDPSYAVKVYPIIQKSLPGSENLFLATPETVEGYRRLTKVLREAGDWEGLLRSAERAERLCELAEGDSSSGDEDLKESRIYASQQKAAVLGILGRFEERVGAVRAYRALLREGADEGLKEVVSLRADHRYRDAFAALLEILRKDWSNPEALLLAADMARVPGVADEFPLNSDPMDHLWRLVILNESLDPGVGEKAASLLDKISARKDEEGRLFGELVRGALSVRSGREKEGVKILENLAGGCGSWEKGFLARYFLGRADERLGLGEEAVAAYRRVLAGVPNHCGALERLRFLGALKDSSVEEPREPARVDFGGKVILCGYSISGAGGSSGVGRRRIVLVWEPLDPVAETCRVDVRILDGAMVEIAASRKNLVDFTESPLRSFRCGELVPQEIEIDESKAKACYLRISLWPQNRPKLLTDCGERSLILGLK